MVDCDAAVDHQGSADHRVKTPGLGNRASQQKVAGLIPGHTKWRCVLGQGTSSYFPRGAMSLYLV